MFTRGERKKSDGKENCHILNDDLFVEENVPIGPDRSS